MPNILIENLAVGMILADEVKNRQGRPLLPAGTEISAKHIKIFKTWGVSQVNIEGDDTTPAWQQVIAAHPQFEAEAEAEQTAAFIFQHVDAQHPLFGHLIPHSREFYLRKKAAEL